MKTATTTRKTVTLRNIDPQIYETIELEKKRQQEGLEMIPSENFVSVAVLQAMGSVMTNKYSEGYPGKRYYGGNQYIDVVESIAIERAKKLFGAEHANVQPYSGSPANLEIYFALLNPGDKVLAMNLAHGGHLTHGSPVNFTGKNYSFVPYGVSQKDERIDYDEVRAIAEREKPKMIVSGATAYPREIDFKKFAKIAEDVGAISFVDMSHVTGLVVGGVHQSPFPETDVVMTTTHKTLRGPRGAMILCKQKHAEAIDKAVFPGMQGGPHDHTTAAIAVALHEAAQPEFKDYARQIVRNSRALAAGLIGQGFRLVSGGTDNHLVLVDLTNKGVTGKEAQNALEKAEISVNKNMVPFDTRSPFNPSGIRMGTPALTTMGMKEGEMKEIAGFIAEVIEHVKDDEALARVKQKVVNFTKNFPLYEEL